MARTARRRRNRGMSRKTRQDLAGLALITLCLIAFAGMFYGAYKIDQARGITISESLDSAGF